MASAEVSSEFNVIYIKILDKLTNEDITSNCTITVEYNNSIYTTSTTNFEYFFNISDFNKNTYVSCNIMCPEYVSGSAQCSVMNSKDPSKGLTTVYLYPDNIAGHIARITDSKTDIKTAIINKGGTISDTATIDTYASVIDRISVGGVPIVAYGGAVDLMVQSSSSKMPSVYSTKENYFPSSPTIPQNAFILRYGTSYAQIYPYILSELPDDGTFKLYNYGDLNVTKSGGMYYIPGIYIIHKDYSTTLYNAVNFKLEVNNVLKSGSYLEYTGIDFSDCIMIGVGVGQIQYFD